MSGARILKVVPTLMCGGTENQFMMLTRGLDSPGTTIIIGLPSLLEYRSKSIHRHTDSPPQARCLVL